MKRQTTTNNHAWIFRHSVISMFFAALLLCMFSSCKDDNGLERGEKTVKFSIDVPSGFAPGTYALGVADESKVNTVDVFVFDDADKYVYGPYTGLVSGNDVTVALPDDLGAGYDVAVFANSRAEITAIPSEYLDAGTTTKEALLRMVIHENTGKWNTTPTDGNYKHIPMYGEVTYAQLQYDRVPMVRALARINVALKGNASSKFQMDNVYLANYNSKGYVANVAATAGEVEVPVGAEMTGVGNVLEYACADGNNTTLLQEIYTFEAKAGDATSIATSTCIIVKGTYTGIFGEVLCYYRIDLMDKDANYLPIRRNHTYDVEINDVMAPGYSSLEEAYNNPGANLTPNLTYAISTWNAGEIDDNIGVNGSTTIDVSKIELTFDSSQRDHNFGDNVLRIKSDNPDGWSADIIGENNSFVSWLKLVNMDGTLVRGCTELMEEYPFAVDKFSPVKLSLQENTSGSPRTAYVQIRSGRAVSSVAITQGATPINDEINLLEAASYDLYTSYFADGNVNLPLSYANAGSVFKLGDGEGVTVTTENQNPSGVITSTSVSGTGPDGRIIVTTGSEVGTADIVVKKGDDEIIRWPISTKLPEIATEEANSYIVKPNSRLLFPVSRANNYYVGQNQLGASDTYDTDLLWTDGPNADASNKGFDSRSNIRKISPYKGTDGTQYFYVRTGSAEGNAVVGIRNLSVGNSADILWSWHIWVTDYDPDVPAGQKGTANGDSYRAFMDRNLGALNNGLNASGEISITGPSNGLLYQWGRKDPFPGSTQNTTTGGSEPYIFYGLHSRNQTSNTLHTTAGPKSMDESVRIPYSFITVASGDWCSDATDDASPRWGTTGSKGTDYGSSKSVLDPCPPGWRVPKNGSWSGSSNNGWLGSVTTYAQQNDGQGGVYPASGRRSNSTGSLGDVGTYGYYWSASPGSATTGYYLDFNSSVVNPSYNYYRSGGCSVRCLQDYKGY